MGRRLENKFSWSHSRARVFERCLREYFLTYYGSWEGWHAWASQLARLAYRLKKLQGRHAWAGSVVHHYAAGAVSSALDGRPQDPAQVLERAHERMKAQWETSARGDRSSKDETGFWGLLEHEYRQAVSKEEWASLWDGAKKALQGFFAAGWPQQMADLGRRNVLALDTGEFDPGSIFRVAGVDVWAKPDLIYQAPAGDEDFWERVVVDWKTGKPSPDHADQVAGYGLFLRNSISQGEPPTAIRAEIHYLASGTVEGVALTEESIRRFQAKLIASVAGMKGLLINPRENEPKEMGEFPMTEDRAKCSACAFRRICGRENN